MYDTIRIHTPLVELPKNSIRVSTLSTIPEELRGSIQVINAELLLNDEDGPKTEPMGSIIAYKKTTSGYNCWAVAGPHTNIIEIGESLYIKPPTIHAITIPSKDDVRPVWARNCNLIYNEDGTATLKYQNTSTTARVGTDFLLCHGTNGIGSYNVSILTREDHSYENYLVCNEYGIDIGKLCEFYPA